MKKLILLTASLVFASFGSISHAQSVEAADLGITKINVIREAAPIYPFEARRKRQDANVLIGYDVNENGRAVNIQVLESDAGGKFAIAAKRAIKQTIFEAHKVDGEAVTISGLMKRYKFEIVDHYSLARASVRVSDL